MATARELGVSGRKGLGLGLDFALRGPKALGEMYRAALPKLGDFASGLIYGEDNEPAGPPQPLPDTTPSRGDFMRRRKPLPAALPWDQNATDALLGTMEPINKVAEAHRPYLRYDADGDGRMSEYTPGREAPERLPGVSRGGGTVSMMSGSPEAAARATSASRMEDLGQAIQEQRGLAALGDPYGLHQAEAEARLKHNPVDVRRADIVDGLAELEQGLAAKVQAGEMSPDDAKARLAEGHARAKRFLDGLRSGFPPLGSEPTVDQ